MLKHQAISTRNVDLVFIVLPIFIQKYYIYCEQYKKMKLHFWKKKKNSIVPELMQKRKKVHKQWKLIKVKTSNKNDCKIITMIEIMNTWFMSHITSM